MGLLFAGKTHIGMVRKSNQDSIYIDEKRGRLFIVADGMGGHKGGDIASQMAVKIVPQYCKENAQILSPENLLQEAISLANSKIKLKADENKNLEGMGTTIVSFLFKNSNLYIGNIGDSRAYLFKNNLMYQMTKDHSLVQEKLNCGIYGREEAAKDPQKNVLVRTVGFDNNVQADVYTYKVSRNDIFMCCSDGLYGLVSDPDLLYLMNKHIPEPANATKEDLNTLVEEYLDLACKNGGSDNISVIVVLAK